MGVAPTGQIFKGFTFDGESSKDYGIYITGSAVYNAPVRDVDMITIPGRNGAFALDKGRFENIEVTYPAGIYAQTESDFAQGISDFRNFLASRQGYVELSDDYNTGEYRLAVYKSGLDVSPEQLRAGEFEIVFECKPQRFLTSGETEETVANNGTLDNPTLFDAHPMLEVWGSGTVSFAGQSVTVNGTEPIGQVLLAGFNSVSGTQVFDEGLVNNGDTITATDFSRTLNFSMRSGINKTIDNVTLGAWSGQLSNPDASVSVVSGTSLDVVFDVRNEDFTAGSYTFRQSSAALTVTYTDSTSSTISVFVNINYTGGKLAFSSGTSSAPDFIYAYGAVLSGEVYGDSTLLTAGSPCYIDLDIGEAYKEVSGSYVSLNNTVEIGGDLPVLPPGTTTFTYPNTVTQLKVIPRWWKV